MILLAFLHVAALSLGKGVRLATVDYVDSTLGSHGTSGKTVIANLVVHWLDNQPDENYALRLTVGYPIPEQVLVDAHEIFDLIRTTHKSYTQDMFFVYESITHGFFTINTMKKTDLFIKYEEGELLQEFTYNNIRYQLIYKEGCGCHSDYIIGINESDLPSYCYYRYSICFMCNSHDDDIYLDHFIEIIQKGEGEYTFDQQATNSCNSENECKSKSIWNNFTNNQNIIVQDLCLFHEYFKSVDYKIFDIINWDRVAKFGVCQEVRKININSVNISKARVLATAFAHWSSLETINGLSNLDTSNIESMDHMFAGCSSLKEIDLSVLDTRKVTSMVGMFSGCTSLTKINLSGLEMSNVEYMENIFQRCPISVIDITNIKNLNYDIFIKVMTPPSVDFNGWFLYADPETIKALRDRTDERFKGPNVDAYGRTYYIMTGS